MARKGMKIQVDKIHFDKKWHEYTIKLNKGGGKFFVEVDDGPLKDILKSSKIDWEYWDTYKGTQRAIKKAVDEYIESKIEKVSVKTKVILFTMEMDYSILGYDEDGDWYVDEFRRDENRSGGRCHAPRLKFGYRLAMRVDLDDEFLRYHKVDDEPNTIHISHDEEELIWSQEAEALFSSLKGGLEELCSRLNKFFGEDNGKVLENLKSFDGHLLSFASDHVNEKEK